jgi:hypothetical protein
MPEAATGFDPDEKFVIYKAMSRFDIAYYQDN